MLEKSIGVKIVVDKQREIYFIDNIKFHLDRVQALGTFVEIEATDLDGIKTTDELYNQCQDYIDLFSIRKEDLVSNSYSDLLLR